jgi:cytochrome c-type biogenesis protein CcmH/NrfG
MTWDASSSFEQGDFVAAAARYQAILKLFPRDPVAQLLMRDCSIGSGQVMPVA